MRPRFTREQIVRWLHESGVLLRDAEMYVLVDNGSRASRSALDVARFLHATAIRRAWEYHLGTQRAS